MNIGYIKLDKLNRLEKIYRKIFKIIRIENNYFYIPENNEKIIKKLLEKLQVKNIDYIISENDININYNRFNGKYLIKYALPEIIDYCLNIIDINPKQQEIHICVEKFSKENIDIIETLVERVKVVNLVTNHLKQFQELEKRLDKNERYITVSNNKRKSLKKSNIIINLDFKNLNEYNVNRNAIIINCNKELNLNKDFEGICIERIDIEISKILRIFSENKNMNKQELFEAELAKQQNYDEARYILEKSKIKIKKLIGKRGIINLDEFIKLKNSEKTQLVKN